nr:MAG TPA: hypothetical protein [Caudoviricetes sp.]
MTYFVPKLKRDPNPKLPINWRYIKSKSYRGTSPDTVRKLKPYIH